MGIPNLLCFLRANPSFWDTRELNNTKLVIDSNNLYLAFFHKLNSQSRDDIYGGDLVSFASHVREFFKQLELCNIEPILVRDGSVLAGPASNNLSLGETIVKTANSMKLVGQITESNRGHIQQAPKSGCLSIVYRLVVRELNLKRVRTPYGADCHAARLANELKCPLLSNDSDFSILPINEGWILVKDVVFRKARELPSGRYSLSCRVFNQSKLFNRELMPLFGALARAPWGQRGPFHECIPSGKYKGDLTVLRGDHEIFANLITKLANYQTFEGALYALTERYPFYTEAIREVARKYKIPERHQQIADELESIYPASDYLPSDPSKEPVQLMKDKLNSLPVTALTLIFQKPYFEMAMIDDTRLPPSTLVRLRGLAIIIALVRPKWQASNQVAPGDVAPSSSRWKFVVYHRAGEDSCELVESNIEALDELEGFGCLRNMHIGTTMQMDLKCKRQLLLASFRYDNELNCKIGLLTAAFLTPEFNSEAQTCLMLIRYCAIEGKLKPMAEFIEAILITLIFYDENVDPGGDTDIGKARIAAKSMVAAADRDTKHSRSRFRSIMHLLSQLTIALSTYYMINSLLGHPVEMLLLQKYLNCPLIYRLTKRLSSHELAFQQALVAAGAPKLVDNLNSLLALMTN